MRVVVTGGSGRIGQLLIAHLLELGHDVVNLDCRQVRKPLARFVYCDTTRREQVQPAIEHADAVCHLGEIPNPYVSGYAPEAVYFRNAASGSVVLQTAADLSIPRVIYTSTCQVYGSFGPDRIPLARLPFDETHPLRPQNCYSLSKTSNETYGQIVARRQGLSVAIFRFPWVVSDSVDEESFQWLERQIGPAPELGIHVYNQDLARAYGLAIADRREGCHAYHFSAKEIISARPLHDRIADHHPDFPKLPADWPAYKSPMLCDKAREHFGWEPQINLLQAYRDKFGREPHQRAGKDS